MATPEASWKLAGPSGVRSLCECDPVVFARASFDKLRAERFIQTSLREWAYAHSYSHSAQRADRLPAFLHNDNFHRPHHSLNLLAPISRLRLPLNNLLSLHS